MSWSGIFKEAATAGRREITIKRSAYNDEDANAIETWSDMTLFKVRGLNHLRVSGFHGMKYFSPEIAQFNSLLELMLIENGLTSLPEEIHMLPKLRVLDVSNNQLVSIPDSIYKLSCLQTVLFSHNQLTIESFPPCTCNEPFPNIQYVDLVGNKLTNIPEFVYKSSSLLELRASHNHIEALSNAIGCLSSLKLIEMHNNNLHDIPSELSQCTKLKFLIFDDNPIADHRLRKILIQFGATKPKAVLDYLHTKSKGSKKGKGKKGKHDLESAEEEETDCVNDPSKISIQIIRPDTYIEVRATNGARQIRPYLVCAVIRQLDLEDDCGDNYRKFITLQTKIHDTVCKKRRVATIATHSLATITHPISYKSAMAHKIHFCPLDWRERTTARKFLDYVKTNKPSEASKKAGDKPFSVDAVAANLSKYLTMVDPSQMVFLEDGSKTVISLPPLTNSETTKITEKTRDIFVEVSSSTSLTDAKTTMDTLIIDMAHSKILSTIISSSDGPAASLATPTPIKEACPRVLIIEPVKVIDETNKLLVHYPSKNDLVLSDRTSQIIQVMRP